jgi:hypothetical protein
MNRMIETTDELVDSLSAAVEVAVIVDDNYAVL